MHQRNVLALGLIAFILLLGTTLAVAEESATININTATAEELVALKGVGAALAARIVEFREQNGPFQAPEDLMKVKGIGQKILDNNAGVIVVE